MARALALLATLAAGRTNLACSSEQASNRDAQRTLPGKAEPFTPGKAEPFTPVSLSGRVLARADERAISGALVRACGEAAGACASTRSDRDGRYALSGLSTGPIRLRAQAPGLSSRGADLVSLAPGPARVADLWLEPARFVSGRVEPASGGVLPKPLRVVALDPMSGDPAAPSVEVGDDGRYELRDLAPGTYDLAAWDGELLAVAAGARVSLIDADREGHSVALAGPAPRPRGSQPRAPGVTGRVVDPHGRPVAGVWVGASNADSHATAAGLAVFGVRPRAPIYEQVKADASGRFELPIGLGAYAFSLHDAYGVRSFSDSDEKDPSAAPVMSVAVAGKQAPLELRAVACEETLRGQVVDHDGRGVKGALVRLQRANPDGQRAWRTELARQQDSLLSGGDGRFVVRDLCPGVYRIIAKHDRASGLLEGASFESAAVVALEPLGTLEGTVSLRGVAVNAFSLVMASEGGDQRRAQFQGGSFRLSDLAAGAYEVLITAPEGYVSTLVQVHGEASQKLGLELANYGSLEGRLVDASGKPLPNVELELVLAPPGRASADHLGPVARLRRTSTDANGRFAMERLIGGRGYITASTEGSKWAWPSALLTSRMGSFAGASSWLDFELAAGERLDLGTRHVRR